MQIVITLNTIEELRWFLEYAKNIPANAEQEPKKAEQIPEKTEPKQETASAPVMPALEPQMTSVSATTGSTPASAPAATAAAPWKAVTRQEVQTKAIALMDAGKQTQLQALLMKYNVPALPSIPEDQLAAFMADLEVL